MPRASLEFAATLYEEQSNLLERLHREDDAQLDAIYDAQHRYDQYVRKLADQPEVVTSIPDFADQRYNRYFQAAAWHVVYLSRNTDVLDKMFSLSFTIDNWDDYNSFHLLEDNEADFIINYLKTKRVEDIRWLYRVSNYIERNRRSEHLDLFFENGQFKYPGDFTSVLGYFYTERSIDLINKISQDKRSYYTRTFLLLQQINTLAYIKSPEGIQYDDGDTLARFSGPSDLSILTAFVDKKPIELRAFYLTSIVGMGNLRALTWLFEQLKYPDVEYRVNVFNAMCQFFYEELDDDPDFERIAEVYEIIMDLEGEDDEDEWNVPELQATYLQTLWSEVQSKILEIRDINKHYDGLGDGCHEFDLLHILRTHRYEGVRSRLNTVFDDLIIYTGQYFPFDCDAYMVKQDAQINAWEEYLIQNQDKFLPGRWVLWGKYIDE
ncbi:hypothetical protein [Shewanella sp.]|uniref:hypothetical protein n=1 Tax=Shewanella sp. TaxID=50422 RepID=UPI003A97DD03